MKRIITSCLILFCAGAVLSAQIVVSPNETVGPIKRMNAVNNGPRINNAEQVYNSTTGYFKAANVGYSRNHDAAARDAEGHLGILVSRYVMDNNITSSKDVMLSLADGKFDGKVRCHVTDEFSMYTEYPVALQPDGTLVLSMEPDSFFFIEF